jgi:hypothetical protein
MNDRRSVRRKRPAPPSFFNSSNSSARGKFLDPTKDSPTDDRKMLPVRNGDSAFPLTLRRTDRLKLFFEGHGHGQAFDDHVVQGSPGIGFKVIRVFSASTMNSGFREQRSAGCLRCRRRFDSSLALPVQVRQRRQTPAVRQKGVRGYSARSRKGRYRRAPLQHSRLPQLDDCAG